MSVTLAAIWPMPKRHPAGGDADYETRQRHIRVVGLLASGNWNADQLARLEGVHRDTIYDWRTKVLRQYDDPEALAIQRQLGYDRESA